MGLLNKFMGMMRQRILDRRRVSFFNEYSSDLFAEQVEALIEAEVEQIEEYEKKLRKEATGTAKGSNKNNMSNKRGKSIARIARANLLVMNSMSLIALDCEVTPCGNVRVEPGFLPGSCARAALMVDDVEKRRQQLLDILGKQSYAENLQ